MSRSVFGGFGVAETWLGRSPNHKLFLKVALSICHCITPNGNFLKKSCDKNATRYYYILHHNIQNYLIVLKCIMRFE